MKWSREWSVVNVDEMRTRRRRLRKSRSDDDDAWRKGRVDAFVVVRI